MKKQNGFIQVRILIAIILGILLLGSGGYFIAHKRSVVITPQEISENVINSEISSSDDIPNNIQITKANNSNIIDICLNIEGIQKSIPIGMSLNGTTCSSITSSVQIINQVSETDLCTNIERLQEFIPLGYYKSDNGLCELTSQNTSTLITSEEIPTILISSGRTTFTGRNNVSSLYFNIKNISNKLIEINGIDFRLMSNSLAILEGQPVLITTEGKENSPFSTLIQAANFDYTYDFNSPIFITANSDINLLISYKVTNGNLNYNETFIEAKITKIRTDIPVEFKYLPITNKVIYIR